LTVHGSVRRLSAARRCCAPTSIWRPPTGGRASIALGRRHARGRLVCVPGPSLVPRRPGQGRSGARARRLHQRRPAGGDQGSTGAHREDAGRRRPPALRPLPADRAVLRDLRGLRDHEKNARIRRSAEEGFRDRPSSRASRTPSGRGGRRSAPFPTKVCSGSRVRASTSDPRRDTPT